MNLLIDALPTTIEIDGQSIPIVTDWRVCLRTILAFEDADLVPQEQQAILLNNLYDEIPENLEEAIKQGVEFLNCGKFEGAGGNGLRLFSFGKDASYIFAAFRQTHGIDLETVDMHWWKFFALFMDLGADTTFSNLVSMRKRLQTGRASKEEQAAARDNPELFDLPDDMSIEEREAIAKFEKLIAKGS
jgi:Bacteriophage Gp15 protein